MANKTNTILRGGENVKTIDQDGNKKDVFVRIVSHLDSDKLLSDFDDPLKITYLCTDCDEESLEKLHPDSYFAIVEKARELNLYVFEKALELDQKKMMNPAYQAWIKANISLVSPAAATTLKS